MGEDQVDRYLNLLEVACERLLTTPLIGRDCSLLRPGLRRIEAGSHVVFYSQQSHKLRIERVLHRSRLPSGKDFAG
jgi:toxin ParE1/3/4